MNCGRRRMEWKDIPEPAIPDDIPADRVPSLLSNWFLGSKARRHLSRRRFLTVTGLLPRSRNGRALDVGCGWGYNLFLLRARGYEPFGIDIVQDDFEAASRISAVNGYSPGLAGADMSSLPFADSVFEAVTAVETYEHVFFPDRRAAVREVFRVLAPGGHFVLSTPNYTSVVETGKRLIVRAPFLKRLVPPMCYPVGEIPRELYHPYSYHRPSPVGEVRSLLESEGFEVSFSKTMIFTWKSVPDILFPAARLVEAILERVPLVRRLGSTLVVKARKR